MRKSGKRGVTMPRLVSPGRAPGGGREGRRGAGPSLKAQLGLGPILCWCMARADGGDGAGARLPGPALSAGKQAAGEGGSLLARMANALTMKPPRKQMAE